MQDVLFFFSLNEPISESNDSETFPIPLKNRNIFNLNIKVVIVVVIIIREAMFSICETRL